MKDTELKAIRDRALYQVYLQGLEEGRFSSMREAGEWVRLQPAPQFFISARTASLYVGRILAGISLMNVNSELRRKIWCLHDRYVEYLAANPGNDLSRERIFELLVDEPAPEFFLSMDMTRQCIFKVWKKVRDRWYR